MEKMGINSNNSSKDQFNLIIITPTYFTKYLNRLAKHKNDHNVKTKIVTLDEIYKNKYFEVKGRDNEEKIKYFIKKSLENWNINYTMLVGDIRKMPMRKTHMWDGIFYTDLYYADIYNKDGSFSSWDTTGNGIIGEYHHSGNTDFLDMGPDVGIGRLACSNGAELSNVVKKIIYYENKTFGKDWFKKIILCGGDTISNKKRKIEKYWNWAGRGVFEGEYANKMVLEELPDFKAVKIWDPKGNLDTISILSEVSRGAGFVHFSGHGTPLYWFTFKNNLRIARFGYPFIYFLLNVKKLPIMFFDGCYIGMLDYSKKGINFPCLAWKLISKKFGGAIATIASARASFSGVFQGGATMLAYYFFKAYNSNKNATLSDIFMKAQKEYLKNVKDRIAMQEYNLIGDPSLKIGGYPPKEGG